LSFLLVLSGGPSTSGVCSVEAKSAMAPAAIHLTVGGFDDVLGALPDKEHALMEFYMPAGGRGGAVGACHCASSGCRDGVGARSSGILGLRVAVGGKG
jgi:hypothetical protein